MSRANSAARRFPMTPAIPHILERAHALGPILKLGVATGAYSPDRRGSCALDPFGRRATRVLKKSVPGGTGRFAMPALEARAKSERQSNPYVRAPESPPECPARICEVARLRLPLFRKLRVGDERCRADCSSCR